MVAGQWAVFMESIRPGLFLLFGGNILMAAIAAIIARLFVFPPVQRDQKVEIAEMVNLRSFVRTLIVIWLLGGVVNVLYSGGLPLIWLVQGDEARTYADYGLPTVSGFLNAIGHFAANAILIDFLLTGNRKRLWLIPVVVIYQIVTVNRGGMVSVVMELLGVYLMVGKVNFSLFFKAGCALLGTLLLFGWVGDARIGERGRDALVGMMSDDGRLVFESLPSAAWWGYLYASVGTVNLNAAVDHQQPLGYPYWSILGIFPTVIRGMIYDFSVYELKYPLEMVNPVFNVFTLYSGYLADFGIVGCYAITGVLVGMASWFYRQSRNGCPWAVLAYAVFFQVIILSVFWDNFLGWVSLFQVFLALMYRERIRSVVARML